ncbi:MAG TPA: hypothetical protein VFF43_16515 [Caldimonas sp.]|nr:hypothetical protein [Caldimonas sp.]
MIASRGALSLALAVAAAAGCSADPYRLDEPRSAAGFELAPYAIHEECVSLAAGDRIDYFFTSVAPVAFNLHYHDANAVILPIVRERVTEDSAVFTADLKQIYCLMWEAGVQPTVLDYRIRLLPRR